MSLERHVSELMVPLISGVSPPRFWLEEVVKNRLVWTTLRFGASLVSFLRLLEKPLISSIQTSSGPTLLGSFDLVEIGGSSFYNSLKRAQTIHAPD